MNLGCGLFGLSFELDNDFWGTMNKLVHSGFTAVEPLYLFHDDSALMPENNIPSFLKTIMWNDEKVSELQPQLDQLGLKISSMHVGFLFGKEIEEGCEELLVFSEKSGIKHFFTSLEFDTIEKTKNAVAMLNKAAKILKGTGVSLGYHNHFQEFGIRDSSQRTFMDIFLAETENDVKLQLDAGWQMYGGSDVVDFIKKNESRIMSIHLKDFVKDFDKTPRDDAFAIMGEGVLPTEGILSTLPRLNLMPNGLMIDQDKASKGNMLSEDLEKGADYLKRFC